MQTAHQYYDERDEDQYVAYHADVYMADANYWYRFMLQEFQEIAESDEFKSAVEREEGADYTLAQFRAYCESIARNKFLHS